MIAVFKKEILENLRDRRVVINTLIIAPLFGPLILALVMSFVIKQSIDRAEADLELPVIGAEHAPNFIAYLKRRGVTITEAPENPEHAVRNEGEEVILRIPDTFADEWNAGLPARAELLADFSQQYAGPTRERVRALVEGYSRQIGAVRLQLRGISPDLNTPIQLQTVDLSTPEARGGMVLAFLPYIILAAMLVGAMHIAIDTTAGERERKSLEPLLINPLPRWQIMAGKLGATTLFSLISLALTLVALIYAMGFLPTEQMDMVLNLDYQVIVTVFVLFIPLALLGAALLTILAAFAKSFREAQTYMSMVMIIPMIPSFWFMLNPTRTELWMTTIPFLSQAVMTLDLVRGESIQPMWMLVSFLSTLTAALLLAVLAGTLYNRPKLIFTSE